MRISVLLLLLLAAAVLAWLMRRDIVVPTSPREPVPAAQTIIRAPVVAEAPAPVSSLAPAPPPEVGRFERPLSQQAPIPMSERDLLEDGVWADVERTANLASTERGFNQLLQVLAAASSIEISQQQAAYQNLFMTDPRYLSGDVQVGQVICGERMCAALVSGQNPQQLTAFVERIRSSQKPPIFSLLALDAPATSSSRPGKRLVFSTNVIRDSQFMLGPALRRRPRTP